MTVRVWSPLRTLWRRWLQVCWTAVVRNFLFRLSMWGASWWTYCVRCDTTVDASAGLWLYEQYNAGSAVGEFFNQSITVFSHSKVTHLLNNVMKYKKYDKWNGGQKGTNTWQGDQEIQKNFKIKASRINKIKDRKNDKIILTISNFNRNQNFFCSVTRSSFFRPTQTTVLFPLKQSTSFHWRRRQQCVDLKPLSMENTSLERCKSFRFRSLFFITIFSSVFNLFFPVGKGKRTGS